MEPFLLLYLATVAALIMCFTKAYVTVVWYLKDYHFDGRVPMFYLYYAV